MIRKANSNDILEINILGEKLHTNFSKLFHIETEIDSSIAIVLVNEENNVVNGYLYAIDFGDNVDLLSLYVDDDYRCRKVGTNLIQYLIDNYCYSNKTITLEVASSNIAAVTLYKKRGFEVVNKRINYYNNDDAYIMKWEG